MAGPKGQPYVHNTYGWPEGPVIIPRDSYLGRKPSLFFILLIHVSSHIVVFLILTDLYLNPDGPGQIYENFSAADIEGATWITYLDHNSQVIWHWHIVRRQCQ